MALPGHRRTPGRRGPDKGSGGTDRMKQDMNIVLISQVASADKGIDRKCFYFFNATIGIISN